MNLLPVEELRTIAQLLNVIVVLFTLILIWSVTMRYIYDPRAPKYPDQEPYEDDEEFNERLEKYNREMEAYEVACDRLVDEQLEREAERRMGLRED